MILTVARVMALALLRDRAALAMAFLLPPLIFIVLAAVFAGATGEDIRLRVAILDKVDDVQSRRLVSALSRDPGLQLRQLRPASDAAELRELVRQGRVDAGVLIWQPLTTAARPRQPPIRLFTDPSKAVAASILAGRLQALVQSELSELAIGKAVQTVERLVGGYTDSQRQRLAAALSEGGASASEPPPQLLTLEPVHGRTGSGGAVSYYAGAIAMLFLLFAAMQGAASLVDEQQMGVVDRLLLGPGGTHVVILGKGLFLLAQGVLQVTVIFVVAWLAYGVDLPGNLLPWLVTTLMAAFAATGLALALAIGCRTRQQVQTLTTFVVLILSAVGGSMVPRFLMPPWLQQLGWLTPNAWAVEAYQAVLWRDEPMNAVLPAWGVLAALGVVTTLIALAVAHRLART